MSNDLSQVIPTLFAQGFHILRSNCVMPSLINSDYSTDAKEKGDTIRIPLASAIAVTDVVPGPYAPDPGSVAPTVAVIPLDQWKEAAFTLTQKETANAIDGVVPQELEAAAVAIANNINAFLFSKYKQVYGAVGTAGTTPFASTADALNARKLLGIQFAPEGNRSMVIDPSAEANALALAAFSQMQQSGDKNVITEGHLGRKLGFDWHMDQVVPTHTAGALGSGGASANGATAVGSFTVSVANATSAGSLVVGDLISFAGDSQTYAVQSAVTLAVGNTTVTVLPAIKVAKVGGEAMSLSASHVVNLAFHRDAFGFASRQLQDNRVMGGSAGVDTFSMTDPLSKLTMRLTVRQEHMRTRFAFDVLYGASLVRPELAVRIKG